MNANIVQPTCSICRKPIETIWFARVIEEEKWIIFCSPTCYFSHAKSDLVIPWNDEYFIRNTEVFARMCKA